MWFNWFYKVLVVRVLFKGLFEFIRDDFLFCLGGVCYRWCGIWDYGVSWGGVVLFINGCFVGNKVRLLIILVLELYRKKRRNIDLEFREEEEGFWIFFYRKEKG